MSLAHQPVSDGVRKPFFTLSLCSFLFELHHGSNRSSWGYEGRFTRRLANLPV